MHQTFFSNLNSQDLSQKVQHPHQNRSGECLNCEKLTNNYDTLHNRAPVPRARLSEHL